MRFGRCGAQGDAEPRTDVAAPPRRGTSATAPQSSLHLSATSSSSAGSRSAIRSLAASCAQPTVAPHSLLRSNRCLLPSPLLPPRRHSALVGVTALPTPCPRPFPHLKQRRNASEVRRRGEMRDAFRALQSASRCPHAGRYNVLAHATQLIKQLQQQQQQQRDRDRDRDRDKDREAAADKQQQQQRSSSGREHDQPALPAGLTAGEERSVAALSLSLPLPRSMPPLAASSSVSSSPASSTSSSSSSSSSVSSPSPSAVSLSVASSSSSARSAPLCALRVSAWLPLPSCVCELSGALLAVNPPLLQTLDCPSVAFCLQQYSHSLYALIDQASAHSVQRAVSAALAIQAQSAVPPDEPLPSSLVKRVKSEEAGRGGSGSGLKYEMDERRREEDYSRRRQAFESSNLVGSSPSGLAPSSSHNSSHTLSSHHTVLSAVASSSLKPVSLPLPARSLSLAAADRHDPPSVRALVSHSTYQPNAAFVAPRLVHSATVSLLGVNGAARPVQLSVCIASIRDINTNEWRPAVLCMFVPLAAAVTNDTAVSGMAVEELDAGHLAGAAAAEWAPESGGPDPSSGVNAGLLLSSHHQQQLVFPQPPPAFSWQSRVDMERPSVSRSQPPSAASAPSAPPSTFSPRALPLDYSTVVAPLHTLLPSPQYHTADRHAAPYSYLPYSDSEYYPASSASSLSPSLLLSSTTSAGSSSAPQFSSSYDPPSTGSSYGTSVLSASASLFAPTQHYQLSVGSTAGVSLSPKSLAHRLLSNLHK